MSIPSTPIRTRDLPRKQGKDRSNLTYDVQRYLGQELPRNTPPGNLYRWMVSPSGALVRCPIHSNRMQRNDRSHQAMGTLRRLHRQGFFEAHVCPIFERTLNPDDERALFGDSPEPCTDHDGGFVPGVNHKAPILCKHLVKIREQRMADHAEKMKSFKSRATIAKNQTEMVALLSQIVADNHAKNPPVRTKVSK